MSMEDIKQRKAENIANRVGSVADATILGSGKTTTDPEKIKDCEHSFAMLGHSISAEKAAALYDAVQVNNK